MVLKVLWEAPLLEKLKRGVAAPFYIISASGYDDSPRESLKDWQKRFVALYLKSVGQRGSWHPDIVEISKEDALKAYKIEDKSLQRFFDAQRFRPLELSRRLVLIADAEGILESYASKMLKPLEEPQENTTTFFLKNTQAPLLKTIESRAIQFSLPAPSLEEEAEFSFQNPRSWFSYKLETETLSKKHKILLEEFFSHPEEAHELFNALKKDPVLQETLFHWIFDWHRKRDSGFQDLQGFLDEVKWFEKAKALSNSPLERFFGLFERTFGESGNSQGGGVAL